MLSITSIPGAVGFKDVRKSLKKHSKYTYTTRSLGQIKTIAIHHSATTSGSAEAFANYHVNDLGWPGIGYAFVIEQDGTVKWCHELEKRTYHVGNSNTSSAGICIVGNFTVQDPTKAQYQSLYALVDFLMKKLPSVKGATNIRGHQEYPGYRWKPCPSLDMDQMRGNIAAGVKEPVRSKFQNDQNIKVNPVKAPVKTPNGISQPNPDYYVIQEGDTLWQIANNHDGLSVEDLLRLNPGLKPTSLKVGEHIKLKGDKTKSYKITKGDTFWELARRFNVTVEDLEKANPKVNPKNLKIGQVISIPSQMAPTPKPVQTITAPKPVIKYGQKGANVKQLQEALNSVYFKCGTPDGIFGSKTLDALKRFQSVHANPVDGVYGTGTRDALAKKLK
jgi:N-acetylmuramoyl-L-alanine amidase